jgi:VIT1/CCC1 family predicted Fe2+/Mn2+ transporter
MKTIYITLLGLVVLACNSTKEVTKADREPVHRYSVVYEGNKIIRYNKNEERNQLDETVTVIETKEVEEEPQSVSATKPQVAKRKSPVQQILKTATQKSSGHSEIKAEPETNAAANEKETIYHGSDLGWGFAGFLSAVLGLIAFFVGIMVISLTEYFWLAALILVLLGLTAAIIGMASKKSKTDYWFGVGALASVGITIAAFFIFMFFYFSV